MSAVWKAALIGALVTAVIVWAVAAFVSLEPNPFHWAKDSRAMFALAVATGAWLGGLSAI